MCKLALTCGRHWETWLIWTLHILGSHCRIMSEEMIIFQPEVRRVGKFPGIGNLPRSCRLKFQTWGKLNCKGKWTTSLQMLACYEVNLLKPTVYSTWRTNSLTSDKCKLCPMFICLLLRLCILLCWCTLLLFLCIFCLHKFHVMLMYF
jgi:hypothetical protein